MGFKSDIKLEDVTKVLFLFCGRGLIESDCDLYGELLAILFMVVMILWRCIFAIILK